MTETTYSTPNARDDDEHKAATTRGGAEGLGGPEERNAH
jgi:hypothetical protein